MEKVFILHREYSFLTLRTQWAIETRKTTGQVIFYFELLLKEIQFLSWGLKFFAIFRSPPVQFS